MDTSNLRFILFAGATFVATFAAVSWGSSHGSNWVGSNWIGSNWVAKAPTATAARTAEPQAEPTADRPNTERVALLQTDPEPGLPPKKTDAARQPDPILQPPIPQPRPALAPARGLAPAPQAAGEPVRDQLAITTVAAASAYTRAPCDGAARAAFIVAASTYLRAKSGDADTSSPADTRAYQAIKVAMAGGGLRRDDFLPGTDLTFAAATRTRGNMACASSAALQRR